MPTFVRVKDKNTGHEFSISANAVRDHHTLLDKPAVDRNGRPLRPQHKSSAYLAAPASTPEPITSEEL